jgi:hypothetical protein
MSSDTTLFSVIGRAFVRQPSARSRRDVHTGHWIVDEKRYRPHQILYTKLLP